MKSFATLLIFVTAALPFVSAHGFVSQVAIDGTLYKGNHPNKGEQFPSPVRLINDPAPVKHADNPNLSCGQNAKNAKVVADANPGSLLTFSWQSGDDSVPLWPHNTGPMITYMAECTGTTCDKFDSTQAKWFKIHEVGKKTDGKTWVQADIQSGKSLTVPLPDDIKAGDYLVRHEIVALHLATDIGGAEFYPSCTQVRVGGNGTGVPDKTVSFPGAYKDDSAGIFDPTVRILFLTFHHSRRTHHLSTRFSTLVQFTPSLALLSLSSSPLAPLSTRPTTLLKVAPLLPQLRLLRAARRLWTRTATSVATAVSCEASCTKHGRIDKSSSLELVSLVGRPRAEHAQ
ncbi:unnamed protein product [Somion occarium]|uniref:lytic cellulose monooxygenase (C4-dehydrogenating) n=1 Tax=Somion occarium TaxID=3059160 RepID=A0ABP1D808_9APHY